MSFTSIYILAFEVCKIVVPSALAFLAWFQARRNELETAKVSKKVENAEDKLNSASVGMVELHDGVGELKITIDGRLSQLLTIAEKAAFARGQKDLTGLPEEKKDK